MKKKFQKAFGVYHQFGFLFSTKYCFYKATKQDRKYVRLVVDYLTNFAAPIIQKYNQIGTQTQPEPAGKRKVWVCWWQGYEKMPVLCKTCFHQLKKVLNDQYELVLITQDNYADYVDLPDILIERLNEGKIPITQFSDILRQALLSQNGGMWIDSSVWCTEKVNEMLSFSNPFWSVKLDQIDDPANIGQQISDCRWSSFLLGGQKENIVNCFVRDCMISYCCAHEYIIDYFMQNLFIRIGYENVPAIRQLIDSIEASNPKLYELYRHMDEPFDQDVWDQLTEETGFFKLTQKRPYEETINGQLTFYGWLCNHVDL